MEEVGFSPVQDEQQPKQRPTFLTVLCILSWITAVWFTVSSTLNLLNKDANIEKLELSMEMVDGAMEQVEDAEMPSFFEGIMGSSKITVQDEINNFSLMNSSELILYIVQIFAVFLMFNLNKKGFWLYFFVQVALLLFPFTYMTPTSIFIIVKMLSGLLTLAFVIMYAVNLKHMK